MPLATAPQPIPLELAPAAAGVAPNPLAIPWVQQRVEQWCWAACIQMFLNAHGVGEQQCDVVNKQFNQAICCGTPQDPACNQPLRIWDIVGAWNNWRVNPQILTSAVQFGYLVSEITAGRPVEVGFAWNGGNFHIALAYGTAMTGNGPYVRVNDPYYGSGWVSYTSLLNAYSYGTWQWTWVSIG